MKIYCAANIALALLLAGCASTPPMPVEKPVPVDVPVGVKCTVDAGAKPADYKGEDELKAALRAQESLDGQVALLLAQVLSGYQWADQLSAASIACK